MTVLSGIMTESSAVADKSLATSATSMSTSDIQTDQTFDCDSTLSSVASSSTMPALLHHTKRKRLDDVLTKLTLSTCKSLTDVELNECPSASGNSLEQNKSSSDSDSTLTEEQLPVLSALYSPDQQEKIPQKQLSFDSEMSLTVGNLKLNIDDNKKTSHEDKSLLLDRTLSSSSSAAAEMLSLVLTGDFSLNVPKTNYEYSSTFREIDSHFNTGSELVPISTTLFTPPTSDSAGGTAEYEDEDEDRAKKDGNYEDTETAFAMMHNAKFNNLVGSHEGSKQQLFKKLPQAKLLSHDLTQTSHKLSEDVYVPDAQGRPRMPKTLLPAELALSSSPPFCTTSFFNRIPYFGLSNETLPTFPICKCKQCITLADQTSSKIPNFRQHSGSRHSLHAWSWHNLKQDSQTSRDPFSYLLPLNLKDKVSTSDLSNENNTSNLTIEKFCKIGDKKRSHSDSDMIPDYFNLFKSLGTKTEHSLQLLQQSDPGLIFNKNGRCVPKPLPKTAQFSSEHSTPQDSPLDLSVKSFSPLIIPSPNKYSPDLIAARNKAITNSSSVPSLSTFISPKHVKSTLSQNAISSLTHSIRASSDDHKTPYKRRNISSSDSLSTLSSISSLSPSLAKQSTDGKILKRPSPLFALYQDENVLSNLPTSKERQSGASSTVTSSLKVCHQKESIPSSIKSKKAIKQASDRTIARSFNEEKAQSMLSLSDLDTSSFACPICGQTFLLHDRLAKHIASRHKNRQQSDNAAKNYLCDVCDRSFARSDMLTRHMRLHTGIKPYTCKICGQVFSRSDHLSTHQRTHTGEKPYKCPQCPYAACRRDMITRHMRTHSRYEVPDSSSSIDELSKSA